MANPSKDRSQQLLKVPRDQTPVTLMLEDGERANAFLFIPPGASVLRMLEEPAPFVPVSFAPDPTRLVARTAIVCTTIHSIYMPADDGMPREQQAVRIRLRGGHIVNGELRWIAPVDRARILDHLNDETAHVVVHDGDHVSYVSKRHISSVEEL